MYTNNLNVSYFFEFLRIIVVLKKPINFIDQVEKIIKICDLLDFTISA